MRQLVRMAWTLAAAGGIVAATSGCASIRDHGQGAPGIAASASGVKRSSTLTSISAASVSASMPAQTTSSK